MKSITIDIDPDGNSKMEGGGFKGKECDAKMKAFEDGLGEVKARQCKIEYHQPADTAQKVKQ